MVLNQQGREIEKALNGNEWYVLASKGGGEKGRGSWWKAWRWWELGNVERGVYTWLKIRSASELERSPLPDPPPRELSHQLGLGSTLPTSFNPQGFPLFLISLVHPPSLYQDVGSF